MKAISPKKKLNAQIVTIFGLSNIEAWRTEIFYYHKNHVRFCSVRLISLKVLSKKGIAQAKHKQNLKRAEHRVHWTMGILPPLKHYSRRQRIMVNWHCSSPPHCQ